MTFIENFVRPFVGVVSTPAIRVRAPPPKVQPEAFIRWGAPAAFDAHDFRSDAARQPWQTFAEEDPEPEKRHRLKIQVLGRAAQKITYTNPTDVDQFVTVANVTGMKCLNTENGDEFNFTINGHKYHGSPIQQEDDGQDPEEPPSLSELNERPEWKKWNESHKS